MFAAADSLGPRSSAGAFGLRSTLRWFDVPHLATPALRRRARTVWMASWPFFGVVAVVLGIAVLVDPPTLARRATTVAAVGVLVTILHMVSRSGRPTLASWMLVLGLTAVVTQRAWITGGIHAPVAVFYVLFIVMAGAIIGTRGGLVTAAASLIGAIVLSVGTSLELLTPRAGAGSVLSGFVFVVLAIGLALVLQGIMAMQSRRAEQGLDAQMLVHDMRSPIQAVLAHLHLLREDPRGEGLHDVEGAIESATTLHRMTNSLLDVSRIDAGQMPVQRVLTDLSYLAQRVVASVRVLQPVRDVAIETRGDPWCKCDPELTRRIIQNLVSNAMKHTEIEGRVRIVIWGSRDRVSIAVNDEGPGVPAERHSRIFDEYSAAGLESMSGHESSGLGLAFCKRAAEVQGGAIRIEDRAPRGSVFIVDLPR